MSYVSLSDELHKMRVDEGTLELTLGVGRYASLVKDCAFRLGRLAQRW